ncbi:UNVERIFIED_CONTAM: hypothetical protein Sangu_2164200 [Sesamum angustifolium]|uniref:Uncharacterized protein n=1 Tax=Sesamum angustifolium TaxID=2727405 RepID=A0AAW2LGC4_9LAMI
MSRDKKSALEIWKSETGIPPEIKEKIVANLGNFAYDPYNYTFLRQSPMRGSWSLPLEEFAMLVQMQQMLKSSVNVMGFLLSFNAYPVLLGTRSNMQVSYTLGSLYYLCNATTRDEILRPEIVDAIKRFAAAGAVNVGFSNLAQAFLDKHVSELN